MSEMRYVQLGALRCGASLRRNNLQQLYVLSKHIAKKKQKNVFNKYLHGKNNTMAMAK